MQPRHLASSRKLLRFNFSILKPKFSWAFFLHSFDHHRDDGQRDHDVTGHSRLSPRSRCATVPARQKQTCSSEAKVSAERQKRMLRRPLDELARPIPASAYNLCIASFYYYSV